MSDTNTIEGDDFVELSAMRKTIRAKILHTLSVYPYLNPSMLQVGIGTAISPKIWHPVKDALIREGAIVQYEMRTRSHAGRDQMYTILKLKTATPHEKPLPIAEAA